MNRILLFSSLTFCLMSCSQLFEDENLEKTEHTLNEKEDTQGPASLRDGQTPEPPKSPQDFRPNEISSTSEKLNISSNFSFVNETTIGTGLGHWLDSLPFPNAHDPEVPFASYSRAENVLFLRKNTALSFASFALDRPLTIRSFGHDIILAGGHLDSVHVDTSHPGSSSGSLYVFTENESQPTFRVEGAQGESGRNGDCSDLGQRCVPVSDHTTRIDSPFPSVEWKEVSLRRMVLWTDPILSEAFKKSLVSATQRFQRNYSPSDLCSNAEYAIVNEKTHNFSGEVELIQTIKMPISFQQTQYENERNSRLYAGSPGSDGQDSGHVIVLRLGSADATFKTPIPGGLGGRGGRNYKTAPLNRTAPFTAESHVVDEQIGLSKFKITTVLTGRCGGQIGRPPLPARAEFVQLLKEETVKLSTGFLLSSKSISLESIDDGADLPKSITEFETNGRSGKSGWYERRVYGDRKEWANLMPTNLLFPED
jgi:hypothetical protein